MASERYTCIGGQAVLEGVMMRSPRFMAVVVRRSDGRLVIKERPWLGFSERIPLLKKPFLRGIVVLLESLTNGLEALNFSADVAMRDEGVTKSDGTAKGLSRIEMITSISFAFLMGTGLFVALPHLLALAAGRWGAFPNGVESPFFHLLDGVIKTLILVGYIAAIALMRDIKRVFQYHGAEHKSIHAFEKGEELIVENARRHPTMHPRCGTSFLLFLVLVSVVAFSVTVAPLSTALPLPANAILKQLCLIALKIVLMFPIAAVSYEIIRFSGNHMGNPLVRALVAPGLWLQKLTTREPDDEQLEVALASLRRVLLLEKDPQIASATEIQFRALADIPAVAAAASEFPG